MTTTRFEERLRAIAADNPRLSIGAALRLAERTPLAHLAAPTTAADDTEESAP